MQTFKCFAMEASYWHTYYNMYIRNRLCNVYVCTIACRKKLIIFRNQSVYYVTPQLTQCSFQGANYSIYVATLLF